MYRFFFKFRINRFDYFKSHQTRTNTNANAHTHTQIYTHKHIRIEKRKNLHKFLATKMRHFEPHVSKVRKANRAEGVSMRQVVVFYQNKIGESKNEIGQNKRYHRYSTKKIII